MENYIFTILGAIGDVVIILLAYIGARYAFPTYRLRTYLYVIA
jgi:hypothetical protein